MTGMDVEIIFQIVALLICICFSAFFSCSETALFSLPKQKLNVLSKKGDKKANLLASHLSHAPNLLITILIGNMFVNILSTSISERLATGIFADYGLAISIIVMTFIIIVFGEVTPKVIAVNNAQKISLFVIPYIDKLYTVVAPLRIVLYRLSDFFISAVSRFIGPELSASYEEIRAMIMESHRGGILYSHEKEMIEGILKLNRLRIKDIMTPRTGMIFFEVNDPPEKIFSAMRKGKFSRIPIYENHVDNIIGILYVKDFLLIMKKDVHLKNILRKPYFVPETKFAHELFREMRNTQTHLAVVVDEYGGVEGLVTMEDILEEIFGDILDKKDVLLTLKTVSPHSMKVSGRLSIEDFNEVFDANLKDDINVTIGGYLLSRFGHIPKKGERYVDKQMEFLVTRAKQNRIEDIIVTRKTYKKIQGKKH